MTGELIPLFRRNFPFIVREEAKLKSIFENREYRKQGIGAELLSAAEELIKKAGYEKITVGAGYDYLMPGVPTNKRFVDSVNERLYEGIDDTAAAFFEKRGYSHSWEGNCFDMRFPLTEFTKEECCPGEEIDGICFRFATPEDKEKVFCCTDAAYEIFTPYYKSEELYRGGGEQNPKVLIATEGEEVVGTLLVSLETEGKGLGSVGCTTVKPSHRGRRIATNMVAVGTKYLKDAGMKEAYLGYTYTGLDYLYGVSGYKICIYYMMAEKRLE